MRIIPLLPCWLAIMLAASLDAPPLEAQRNVVVSQTGTLISSQRVVAGRILRVTVVNVDGVCFDYGVIVQQPQTANDLRDWPSGMNRPVGGADSSPAGSPDPVETLLAARVKALEMRDSVARFAVAPSAPPGPSDKLDQRLSRLQANLAGVRDLLVDKSDGIAGTLGSAMDALRSYRTQCPTTVRPADGAAGRSARWVNDVAPRLVALRAALRDGIRATEAAQEDVPTLIREGDELREADPEWVAASRGMIEGAVQRSNREIPRLITRLRTEIVEAEAMTAAWERSTDSMPTTLVFERPVRRNADSVGITLTVSRRDGLKLEPTPEMPTLWLDADGGGGRFFLSAGYMASQLVGANYEAVVVPSGDTTISSFADINGGGRVSAPFIAGNVRLLEPLADFDIAATFGTSTRSVNGQQKLDWMGGLSLVVGRAIAITAGFHRGSREILLVSQAALDAGLPSAVTEASVVGDRPETRFFWGVSMRVR